MKVKTIAPGLFAVGIDLVADDFASSTLPATAIGLITDVELDLSQGPERLTSSNAQVAPCVCSIQLPVVGTLAIRTAAQGTYADLSIMWNGMGASAAKAVAARWFSDIAVTARST
jgi:hypothetical protein